MRSLEQALDDHELTVLRVIGEWWETELAGADKETCVKVLAERLSQLDMEQEMLYLPPEDAVALTDLVTKGGRIPVATFSRSHGEVRLMGPGRLEREEPWLDPISPTEALWYRGVFMFRGFDETAEGVIEFFYLPQEIQDQFPQEAEVEVIKETAAPRWQPVAAPTEVQIAVTDAVEDLTAILSLAQSNALQHDNVLEWSDYLVNADEDRRSLLMALSEETGMLRRTETGFRPTRAAVDWLRLSREGQLRVLADGWSSSRWNDLFHTPGLSCEGEGWQNDPILARTALLDALPRPEDWYQIYDLVAHIKQVDPDFQRPDGNYEIWYIRDLASDTYITGFDKWELVEGRLLRFLLTGPGGWLGLVETSASETGGLYRLTSRALDWLANKPAAADAVDVPLVVNTDATILVPYNAGRYQRFQAARISQADPIEPGQPYCYRLTPQSLALAKEQGISPERIQRFLQEASGRPVPASLRRAIERWSDSGVEARVESSVILLVRDAGILETLRSNPKTRDYIGESLGDLSVVIRKQEWQQLVAATAQLGLLLDVQVEH